MKKIITILGILIVGQCFLNAQQFINSGDAPFGLQIVNFVDTTGLPLKIMMTDMEGDGDLDIFYCGIRGFDENSMHFSFLAKILYYFEVQENIGDKYNPEFAPRRNAFEQFPFPTGTSFMIPSMGDLNGDNRTDVFVCSETNEYEQQFPLFYLQQEDQSFDKSRCTDWDLESLKQFSQFMPNLFDMDADGDLDILMTGDFCVSIPCDDRTSAYFYAKNIGSNSDPQFLGWFENPYGLEMGDIYQILDGGDFDLDGDTDLLSLSNLGDGQRLDYFENKQETAGKPSFGEFMPSPFGLPEFGEDDECYFPGIGDIDGDGDVDLLIPSIIITDVDTTVHIFYYENVDCQLQKETIEETICEGEVYIINGEELDESGTYYIEETLANGCKKVTEVILEVIPSTEVIIEEELCLGESYTIAENVITESGHYEFNLMSESGCDSLVIADLLFIAIDESIIVDGAYLTAVYNTNYSYQWFDCDLQEDIDTATHNSFRAPYVGTFGVRITDENNCEEESECYVVDPTGISKLTTNEVSVYPNPAKGELFVKGLPINSRIRFELFNMKGNMVSTGIVGDEYRLDISKLNSGLYYLKLQLAGELMVKEVIILN